MLDLVPLYCEHCKLLDTTVVFNENKKEFCLNCGKEMVRATGGYGLVPGFCHGCKQSEYGIAPMPLVEDDDHFIVGSHCPNCHKIGQIKVRGGLRQ